MATVLDSASVGQSVREFTVIVLPLFCSVEHCSSKSVFKKRSILKLQDEFSETRPDTDALVLS